MSRNTVTRVALGHAREMTKRAASRQTFGFVVAVVAAVPALLGLTFTLGSSTVTYTASDPRDTWQGVAPLEDVRLTESPAGMAVTATLEPGRFDSGNFARDGNARFTVFDTGDFPTATLEGTLPLPEPLRAATASGETITTFRGTLSLHGVARELTFPLTVVRDGARADASGTFTVLLSDYGMTRPSLFGTTVNDRVDLSVALTGEFAP